MDDWVKEWTNGVSDIIGLAINDWYVEQLAKGCIDSTLCHAPSRQTYDGDNHLNDNDSDNDYKCLSVRVVRWPLRRDSTHTDPSEITPTHTTTTWRVFDIPKRSQQEIRFCFLFGLLTFSAKCFSFRTTFFFLFIFSTFPFCHFSFEQLKIAGIML